MGHFSTLKEDLLLGTYDFPHPFHKSMRNPNAQLACFSNLFQEIVDCELGYAEIKY